MEALREQAQRALTAAGLIHIADFRLGETIVSPSRRTIVGPGGAADLQPLVMQVLVVLSEHSGDVVSRELLFERCWGGIYVGDDSLNRVIAALRKLAADVAHGSFEIETITKTGYRLTGSIVAIERTGSLQPRGVSRRHVASAMVALTALMGTGTWVLRSRDNRRFNRLLQQVDAALAGDGPLFRPDVALSSAQTAARMRPDSASALGRLAHAQSYFALYGPAANSDKAVAIAVQTAQKALNIDPRDTNALMAMFELQGSTLDWWSRDQRLRQILVIDPAFGPAMAELTSLLQSAGLCRESWAWNERLLRLTPLSQNCLVKRAMKLWIFGRLPDADNTINQVRAQFPNSDWVWLNRFILYALTNRAQAARAMLESEPRRLGRVETSMWLSSLAALAQASPRNVASAREACFAGSKISGDLAGHAIMILCALDDVDSAFDVASGYFLSRGRSGERAHSNEPSDAFARINTQWLFMPPCKNLRADRRFPAICEGVGLVEYWRRRGVQPDYATLDR